MMAADVLPWPDTAIDASGSIGQWRPSHLRKANACIEFIEDGTNAIYRAEAFFWEVQRDIYERIDSGTGNPRIAGLWPNWSGDQLERALAAHAYLRSGLTSWQANNLYWIQLTIYVSRRLAVRLGEPEPEPLPAHDGSPQVWPKR